MSYKKILRCLMALLLPLSITACASTERAVSFTDAVASPDGRYIARGVTFTPDSMEGGKVQQALMIERATVVATGQVVPTGEPPLITPTEAPTRTSEMTQAVAAVAGAALNGSIGNVLASCAFNDCGGTSAGDPTIVDVRVGNEVINDVSASTSSQTSGCSGGLCARP